jgi:hypothetical protein
MTSHHDRYARHAGNIVFSAENRAVYLDTYSTEVEIAAVLRDFVASLRWGIHAHWQEPDSAETFAPSSVMFVLERRIDARAVLGALHMLGCVTVPKARPGRQALWFRRAEEVPDLRSRYWHPERPVKFAERILRDEWDIAMAVDAAGGGRPLRRTGVIEETYRRIDHDQRSRTAVGQAILRGLIVKSKFEGRLVWVPAPK